MSEARERSDSRHDRLSDEGQTDCSARESTGRVEIRGPDCGKKSGHRSASSPQIVLIDRDSADPDECPPSREIAVKRMTCFFGARSAEVRRQLSNRLRAILSRLRHCGNRETHKELR